MKYLGTYEKNQDIATKEKVEAKLSYDATSDTVMQGGADVTEKVAKSLDMYIAPSNIGAVAYTNQELTDEQKQQARTNIGVGDATKDAKGIVQIGDNLNIADGVLSRDKDVFIAIYGTTTYAEILEAYNAGKAIFCKKDRVTAPFLGETNPDLSETGFYFSTINGSVASLYKCLDSGTSTEWSISITNLMPYGNYVTATTLNNRINRTTNVNTADTNYTTLMARGEKLLDATTFDAVTDWSTQLVNGAIAWRYE